MSELPDPIPAIPVLDYRIASPASERPLLSIGARLFYFATIIALPLVCFVSSSEQYPPGPDYQRGWWWDLLGIIPTATAGWPFYPLLLFAMYAAGFMIVLPHRAIDKIHIRFGLATGVLLAFQYSFIQTISVQQSTSPVVGVMTGLAVPMIFAVLALGLGHLLDFCMWRREWFRGYTQAAFWVLIVVVFSGVCLVIDGGISSVAVFFLIAAPGLTLASFCALLLLVRRRGEKKTRLVWPLWTAAAGWLALYAAAWVDSYHTAEQVYAALPISSNCYIATAAARGHRWLTRSRDGRSTPQLAILKAGERAIAARWPGTHRLLRTIYDSIGPRITRRMTNPFIADFACLTLKPFEWATAAVFAMAAMRTREQGKRRDPALSDGRLAAVTSSQSV